VVFGKVAEWQQARAADQRVIAATGVVGHGVGVAKHLVWCTSAPGQCVIAAVGVVGHGVGVADEEIEKSTVKVVPHCQRVFAPLGIVGHRIGVAVEAIG